MRTIDDFDFKDKNVLVRVDFNVPIIKNIIQNGYYTPPVRDY